MTPTLDAQSKTCSVEGCDELGMLDKNGKRYLVLGLCHMHYLRRKRHGQTGAADRIRESHGLKGSPEYHSWRGMIKRCTEPNREDYGLYGARNISVCSRWRNSFNAFLEDMGKKPGPEYSIDRIDVNGNYEPNNCRWADWTTQARNQRIRSDNKSGFRGVRWNKKSSKWEVRIKALGRTISIGGFDNLEEAAGARLTAECIYWQEDE